VICLFPLAIYATNADTTEWKLKITVEKAFIRLKPDINSPVESILVKDTVLESHEKVEEWFRVVVGPDESGFVVIGYVHANDVEIMAVKTTKPPDFWEESTDSFQGIGLRVRILGELNYFSAGDIDKGSVGLYDSKTDFLSSAGYILDKRPESIQPGFALSGDVIYYFKPQIGIGLGAGYIWASGTNLVIVSGQNILVEEKIGFTPKIKTMPVRLGLFFTIPIHRKLSISFNGGPSLYLVNYSYELASTWDDMNNIHQNANTSGIGFHGGIGVEVNLNQRVSFFVEGQGRYAKISNFKGEEKERETIGMRYVYSEENGFLYYLEDEKYSYLAIRGEEPSGFKTVRKATFDFSGFYLQTGLIIKF
jgi:hypothetical protein